jgi:hypothetical protein
MALSSHPNTETLSSNPPFLSYLDSLFESQILCGAMSQGIDKSEVEETWLDWRKRVQHPYFGLSTFFITQNGAAKGGIRLGPTVKALVDGAASDGCDVVSKLYSFGVDCGLLNELSYSYHTFYFDVLGGESSQCIHGICICSNPAISITNW